MAKNWKANDWDTLIRGENCPVCDLIQAASQRTTTKSLWLTYN